MFPETDIPQTQFSTKIYFKDDARQRLLKGINAAAEAVSCTLGPKGKTVLIQKDNAAPIVTKDGVTVSKSIKFKDDMEFLGAELIKEVASRTNEVAGDGTTTSTVLTQAFIHEGVKLLAAGYASTDICSAISDASAKVIQQLKNNARMIKKVDEIAQVATVSANGDVEIGTLIAHAIDKVGKDGIINVEDAKGMYTSMSLVEGMQFERGYISPFFVTNNEKMNSVYYNARVAVIDGKLNDFQDVAHLLELAVANQLPGLLLIAEDIERDALSGLVLNRVKNNIRVCAIKTPGFGQQRDEYLADICALTGARLISSKTGLKRSDVQLSDLGTVKKFACDAKTTTLVGSGNTQTLLDEHLNNLRTQLQDVTKSEQDVSALQSRIARLAGGVAIIHVGGSTELEMIERKYRIEDALNATRAAVQAGIVPGGGMALLDAYVKSIAGEETLGSKILAKVCEAPLVKIVENSGKNPGVVLERAKELLTSQDQDAPGYDAKNEEFVNMNTVGIIDPVKVTLTALRNASSVAITFLSLDAVICKDSDA